MDFLPFFGVERKECTSSLPFLLFFTFGGFPTIPPQTNKRPCIVALFARFVLFPFSIFQLLIERQTFPPSFPHHAADASRQTRHRTDIRREAFGKASRYRRGPGPGIRNPIVARTRPVPSRRGRFHLSLFFSRNGQRANTHSKETCETECYANPMFSKSTRFQRDWFPFCFEITAVWGGIPRSFSTQIASLNSRKTIHSQPKWIERWPVNKPKKFYRPFPTKAFSNQVTISHSTIPF
mmetsp:Transcript_39723/g.102327  ORF Transcript_39723/g.102327 Transcript_39723/m.102327 type:complete len:237 (+) Transcript_39723:3344-4054(+)